MRFYELKYEVTDNKWKEMIRKDRDAVQDWCYRIKDITEEYNDERDKTEKYYLYDFSPSDVSIAYVLDGNDNDTEGLKKYLDAIGLQGKAYEPCEIKFESFRRFLRIGERRDLLDEDDELVKIGLEDFKYGSVRFEEGLIFEADSNAVYKKAEEYLVSRDLKAELDRIYEGSSYERFMGHPVHYLISTDNKELRLETCKLLISALFEKQRIISRRYSLIEISLSPWERSRKNDLRSIYKNCTGGTAVIFFNGSENNEEDRATGDREEIRKITSVIKEYSNRVLTILCLPKECSKTKEKFYDNLGNCSFIEIDEKHVDKKAARAYLKKMADKNGIRADKKLYAALGGNDAFLTDDLVDIYNEWYSKNLRSSIFSQYKEMITIKEEKKKAAPEGDAYEELTQMIGLNEVKRVTDNALSFYKAQKIFADMGMRAERTSMHMVFTGNPGTAKTTVARLLSRIFRDNGVLSKGHLVEVGRSDLVGRYVGWTAKIVKEKFVQANGGILFVDEAYSLVDDRDGLYGDEAINTIVQEMENNRDSTIVIFAGYPDKMEEFLNKNPGLRSRIAFHLHFDDYDTEELIKISELMAYKQSLKLADDAKEKLKDIYDHARYIRDFGNGRYVRNILEKARMAQANRIVKMNLDDIDRDTVRTICAQDIEAPEIFNNREDRIGFV